jgi:hypothetical protein
MQGFNPGTSPPPVNIPIRIAPHIVDQSLLILEILFLTFAGHNE